MKKILSLLLLSIILISCSKTATQTDLIPIHDNFTLESQYVNETRVINVWMPEEFKTKDTWLPVIYMPDGGIKEDFPHIANTISKLIKNKTIPPIILVGVENTKRGRDLTGPSEVKEDAQYCPLTDGAKNFRNFFTEELFPEINKRYRTTKEKGIIGESLAGLFVMETFLLKPETFDFYIAVDPSLWWNNHYLEKNTKKYLKALPKTPTKLWFAGSSAQDISVHTNKIAETMKTQAPETLIWHYSEESDEKHNTIFRATKEKALTWALNKN